MSEMVERVAIAIAAAEATIMFGADRTQMAADPRALARAAIEAMRELPDSYFSVLVRTFNMRDDEQHRRAARGWYHQAIDEALK